MKTYLHDTLFKNPEFYFPFIHEELYSIKTD